jgi:tripartite-type tricarboxylate transporter receptor subunit TctC
MILRVVISGLVGAIVAAGVSAAALAQAYPTKPVRIVVGFAPGGVADIVARTVAPKLSERLGQQFIVDNKPSAGGIVAAELVAKSAPDGYTLLLISGGNAVSSSLYKQLSYDPLNDFAMVSTLGFFDLVVVTDSASPATTLKDLLAQAHAKPSTINMGVIGIGSTQHLGSELLNSLANKDFTVVNYRATPAVLVAVKAQEVQVAVEFIAPVLEQVRAGALRALAVAAPKRSQIMPDVPTAAEAGLPGFEANSWNGIAAPAKTPQAILDRLSRETAAIVAMPDVKEALLKLGIESRSMSPDAMRTFFRAESDKWGRVIAASGIEKQ